MGTLPPETVLVVFLPTAAHTPQERATLQQTLVREIGHGIPANNSLPIRNVTLDFFEAIMSIPSNMPTTSQHHLGQQQTKGHYHYYNGIQPFIPYQALTSHLQLINVEITGAIIIERQFDSLCRCTALQQPSHPLNSALVLRTDKSTKLPPLHSNYQIAPFLMPSNSRPTIWYSHDLPFMNKTSWAKLYSASQLK
jgi:hypothetical protein